MQKWSLVVPWISATDSPVYSLESQRQIHAQNRNKGKFKVKFKDINLSDVLLECKGNIAI